MLGLPLAGSVAVNVWLTYRTVRGADKAADARVAQVETEGHLERVQFELDQTKQALNAANARAAALEGILADDVNAPVSRDLSPADWKQRLLRITQAWGDAAGAASGDAVPADAAAAAAGAGPGEAF